jgi:hypothetical protein
MLENRNDNQKRDLDGATRTGRGALGRPERVAGAVNRLGRSCQPGR